MQTDYKKYIWMTGSLALVTISFAAIAMGMSDFTAMKYPNGQVASITVTGEGEVTAIPDIATVTLTVRESAKTVPEAQKLVEAKIKEVIKELSDLGVDKKDTKTLSYTINPKYEQQSTGYCNGYICPPTKTIIVGYEVAQSMQIKVRKIDKAGEVIGVIGKANVTEVNGPEYTVDDMDKAQADAKAIAIAKAQAKAKATAKSLHQGLGSVMSFSDDNNGYYPTMYRAEAMSMKNVGGVSDSVTLPQGESVIKSRVTITYFLK
ncbi:SIMPL domain-containing protein [Candidatus Gracilibacteria bacterium]|nr:SIMPL domain-containing protein [Candidatus Gracilibacteria bacterium]